MAAFNLLYLGKTKAVILKSAAFLFVSIYLTGMIMYSLVVFLTSVIFLLPLLARCQPLFFWNRESKKAAYSLQWLANSFRFLLWIAVGLAFLLGTILFKDMNKIGLLASALKNSGRLIDLLNTAMLDYFCVGSNLWVFFCTLLLPNLLVIAQIIFFA